MSFFWFWKSESQTSKNNEDEAEKKEDKKEEKSVKEIPQKKLSKEEEEKNDWKSYYESKEKFKSNFPSVFGGSGNSYFSKEREKITFYEYAIIKNWGISANIFVINISLDNSAMRKLYFQTGETNVIQTIMEMYGCIIAGKSLSEMQSILEERDKKFNKNAQTKRIATKYKREQDYEFSSKSSGV